MFILKTLLARSWRILKRTFFNMKWLSNVVFSMLKNIPINKKLWISSQSEVHWSRFDYVMTNGIQ